MPLNLLTAAFFILLGGLLNYVINQLPPLKQFPGRGVLVTLLAIELALLVWVWQVSSTGDKLYQTYQIWFDRGRLVLLGALAINLLLLVIGLLQKEPDQRVAPQPNLRDQLLQAELEEVAKRQEDSLHNQILIDLNMTDEREQVGRPSKRWVINGTTTDLPPATQMVEVFQRKEVGGRLLILGDPGAGKTTMLLELAKSLLEDGRQNPNMPVPIIFSLSTWRRDDLLDWLVEQLYQKYQHKLTVDISREWLKSGQIVPLLDNLDEVSIYEPHRSIKLINRYLETDASLDLVVCCRWDTYQEFKRKSENREEQELREKPYLNLNMAVRLQQLTDAQIHSYLTRFNRTDLRRQIHTDNAMLALAHTPLFLDTLLVAYQGQPIQTKQELWEAYISRQLSLPQREHQEQTQRETCNYLTWLARQMQQQNTTEFLIEELQPNQLSVEMKPLYRSIVGLTFGLIFGLSGWLIFNLATGLITGFVTGLLWWRVDRIKSIEKITFPYHLIVSIATGMIIALYTEVIVTLNYLQNSVLSIGVLLLLKATWQVWTVRGSNIKTHIEKIITLWCTIIFLLGINFVLSKILFRSFVDENDDLFLISVILISLVIFLTEKGEVCIQYSILRILLFLDRSTPWNYSKFLGCMKERRLIQQVGGRYRFIHPLLRDHFAAMR